MCLLPAVKRNANELSNEYPLAVKAVSEAFCVDDGQIPLNRQHYFVANSEIFSPEPASCYGTPELRDDKTSLTISDQDEVYAKTLGISLQNLCG